MKHLRRLWRWLRRSEPDYDYVSDKWLDTYHYHNKLDV